MFLPGGPKPWQTKVGQSKLDTHIVEVAEKQKNGTVEDIHVAGYPKDDAVLST